MNSRDIAYWERTLNAWGQYVRQGRTFPNTLGYPRSTVEAAIQAGTTESGCNPGAKIPVKFCCDRIIERLDNKMMKMPDAYKQITLRRYVVGMSTRDIARAEDISHSKAANTIRQVIAWVHGAMTE